VITTDGPLQGRAIGDVAPATLIMYGSHERVPPLW